MAPSITKGLRGCSRFSMFFDGSASCRLLSIPKNPLGLNIIFWSHISCSPCSHRSRSLAARSSFNLRLSTFRRVEMWAVLYGDLGLCYIMLYWWDYKTHPIILLCYIHNILVNRWIDNQTSLMSHAQGIISNCYHNVSAFCEQHIE